MARGAVEKERLMNETTANLASRWKRLGGALIDGVLTAIVMVPVMAVTGMTSAAPGSEGMTFGRRAGLFVLGCVVFLVLNGYLLYKRGQTIGKVAVKTKIVDLNGQIPDFGRLVALRYLVMALVGQIPFLGGLIGLVNALFIFRSDRRCLHDHIAGTRVVEA